MEENIIEPVAIQPKKQKSAFFHWSKGLLLSLGLLMFLLIASTGYILLGENASSLDPRIPLPIATPTPLHTPLTVIPSAEQGRLHNLNSASYPSSVSGSKK